jgi:hypothetical protein
VGGEDTCGFSPAPAPLCKADTHTLNA